MEARRFRPGLDYTLATSEDKEARLDVILGLMPPEKDPETSTNSDGMEESQVALVGGWDVGLLFKTLHIHFSRFILAKCHTGFQSASSSVPFLCVAALDIDAVGFITLGIIRL